MGVRIDYTNGEARIIYINYRLLVDNKEVKAFESLSDLKQWLE